MIPSSSHKINCVGFVESSSAYAHPPALSGKRLIIRVRLRRFLLAALLLLRLLLGISRRNIHNLGMTQENIHDKLSGELAWYL